MIILIALLAAGAFAISFAVTWGMKRIAPRIGFVDRPGHRKIHSNPKPLGGGVGIFLGLAIPLVVAIIGAWMVDPARPAEMFGESKELVAAYVGGARQQTPLAVGLLIAMGIIHGMGILDDRKALGPFVKLVVQLGVTAGLVVAMEAMSRGTPSLRLRALTALGTVPSIVLTVLWITAITNAFNFLDNMDGLSAGVAAVCTTAFLVAAMVIQHTGGGQMFIAATLALLLGALVGFLCFNFPPASIFMGDCGSLVIGFVLGVLTIRTTYLPAGVSLGAGWWAVLAPVLVLALPLYDLIVVSVIRISRGKSPFVGDTNHFSHRLVARGMSRRTAVLTLYLITAATSAAAILLPMMQTTFGAMLIFGQTVLILGVVGLLEQHPMARE